jgi:putative SOS response-associated peptidase YedK
MCNEYARLIALSKLYQELARLKEFPPFEWRGNQIPNDLEGKPSVRIRDSAPIVRLEDNKTTGVMTTWAWPGPHGKPVFNYVSEGRDFAAADRVLILATGFYEYTAPVTPKVKLKDQHFFQMRNAPWFWIAGIVKNDCFTMLTTAPGEDIKPFHDRQIVTLSPEQGFDWLTLRKLASEILKPLPTGNLIVTTLRRDGVKREENRDEETEA